MADLSQDQTFGELAIELRLAGAITCPISRAEQVLAMGATDVKGSLTMATHDQTGQQMGGLDVCRTSCSGTELAIWLITPRMPLLVLPQILFCAALKISSSINRNSANSRSHCWVISSMRLRDLAGGWITDVLHLARANAPHTFDYAKVC